MQEDKRTQRRFIAGAVCPRCGAMDKMVVDLDSDQRECVACDFREPRPEPTSSRELPTRVSRPAARLSETPAEPVTLLDPGNNTRS